jgi:hypothetical protein
MGSKVTDTVWPAAEPVTVSVYCVGANPELLKVTEMVAGAVAVEGLMVQGFLVCAGATEQLKETGVSNPLTEDPRVISAVELTPGSTAEGLGVVAWREKSACP